jgi:branched-chain amino acid transport system permease protein
VSYLNAVVQGILLGGQYAIFASGLSLMFGVLRVVNLSHGDLGILAAFVAMGLITTLDLPLPVVAVAVLAFMAAAGAALQLGVLQRTMRKGPIPPMIATFGLSIAIGSLLQELFSANSRSIDVGTFATSSLTLGGISVGWLPLTVFAGAVVVLLALHLALGRTGIGRTVRATADDPDTAGLVGVDARRVYVTVVALAVVLAGLAGLAYAATSLVTPLAGPSRLIFAFEAVVIGGLGSLWGTLAGGAVLGVAQAVGAELDPSSGILIGHLVFLGVLAFRPRGLFPTAQARA